MRSSLALLVALSGCSLGNVKTVACDSSAQCRDAFGFGFECGSTGYCDPIVPSNRCDDPYPDDLFTRPEAYGDHIVLGTLFDHASQLENLQSIELAVDEANIDGGLDGTQFALVHCNYTEDLELDEDDAPTAAKQLTTWLSEAIGVPAIVGPGSSPQSEAIWPEAEAAGLLLVAPSSTSDSLTTIDGETSSDEAPGLFWRTAPPDSLQASTIAADIEGRGSTSAAIIHQSGAYGEGLAAGIAGNLSFAPDLYLFENSNDLTAAIADAGNSTVDEVVFASSDPDDIAAFLNGAEATGDYVAKAIFLTDSARDAGVLASAQSASALFPNIRGTVPVPDPQAAALEDTFYLAYQQRYGQDAGRDGFNTFSYDAAWITLYGIAWATYQEPAVEGINIARGLRKISEPGSTEIAIRAASWSDVQEEFMAGSAIDVFGASGSLDYDPTTGETANPIALWVVIPDGGQGFEFDDVEICDTDGTCTPAP